MTSKGCLQLTAAFLILALPVFTFGTEKKDAEPLKFSLNGQCATALRLLEGGPESGWMFSFGGKANADDGEWTITSDVNLKPGESQVIPISLGAGSSKPYILVSLNQTSRLMNSGSEETIGHGYMFTIAMGLDHESNWPQDRFRFAFGGTSTRSFNFTVNLDGSVKRSFYTYKRNEDGKKEGFHYDYSNADAVPESIEFPFTLLHDPRYEASVGRDRFIPIPKHKENSFEAVQSFVVKLKLKLNFLK